MVQWINIYQLDLVDMIISNIDILKNPFWRSVALWLTFGTQFMVVAI